MLLRLSTYTAAQYGSFRSPRANLREKVRGKAMHGNQIHRQDVDAANTTKLSDGALYVASDCAGLNFYEIDRGVRDLLPLYLSSEDHRQLEPHFVRLGALAGGRLDQLARVADKNPPVLNARDRYGRDE